MLGEITHFIIHLITVVNLFFSYRAIATPQILELSGIGNPKILKPLNIPVLVDLPGVGDKLQDHYLCFDLSFGTSQLFFRVVLDSREIIAFFLAIRA